MFERVVQNAPWVARGLLQARVFNGRIILIGGRDIGGDYYNDIWESGNGEDWTQLRPNGHALFNARSSFGMAVHNRRLYISNGLPGFYNDVQSTLDGVHWVQEAAAAAFPGRYDGEMVSFDERLWVIGGCGAGGDNLNDVWSSRDGVQWHEELANGHNMFPAREDGRVVVHNGMMWMFGGLDNDGNALSDVWASRDGIHWELIKEDGFGVGGVINHQMIAFDNKLVVAVGDINGVDRRVLLWSLDGVHGTESQDAEYPARGEMAMVDFDRRIYILGGQAAMVDYNDVWRSVGTQF